MKAVLIQEPHDLQVVDLPDPVPGAGEALIAVRYVGICGADLASYTGNQPFTKYPCIPGHEFSAEIVSIPENDRGLKAGDIVTCNPYFNCGTCYSCKRGLVNACTDNQTMGVQRDGAACGLLAMPIARLIPGGGLSAQELALIEPFAISWHAVSRGHLKAGDKVLITGAGPIGLFALEAARARGAEVYISDILDGRLEMAMQLGAMGTVNPQKEDLGAFTARVTDGNGFDTCIEACGMPETFLACIDQAAFGGDILLIGNGKRETTFLHSILLKKELNVYGSRNAYTKDFEALIDLVKGGKVDVKQMVSCVYSIDDAKEAFEALEQNDGALVKVLLEF